MPVTLSNIYHSVTLCPVTFDFFSYLIVQVNGAVVNVRGKGDKLAVWLADASQPDSILRIGKMIKERLGIDPEQTIGFNIHNEEKARPGSSAKKKFFV